MKQFLNRHGTRITGWVFILVPSLFIAAMLTPGRWFAGAFWLAYLFGVPVLLLLASTEWVRHLRPGMPSWRNGLCLSAFLIAFLNWAYVTGMIGIPHLRLIFGSHSNWIDSDPIYFFLLMQSDLVALMLAIALKRAPRIQMIGVGLLMLLFVGCQLAVSV